MVKGIREIEVGWIGFGEDRRREDKEGGDRSGWLGDEDRGGLAYRGVLNWGEVVIRDRE